MQTFKTSIIIPCYFADESFVEMTRGCLDSLKYGKPDEVILVDDNAPLNIHNDPDEIITRTLTGTPYDYILSTGTNGGYATAVNTGLFKAAGEILIVSNNDITFTPGWLEAILNPLYEGYDISSIRTSDTGYLTEDKVTEGDKFGSLWAMKREVYDKLGGLDESFGNYFEDLDYRRRAIQAGFRIAKNHGAVVEHEGRATFKEVDPDNTFYKEAKQRYWDKWKDLDKKALADDFKGDPDFTYLLREL